MRQRRLSGLQLNVDQQERTGNQCTKRGKLDEEGEEGESLPTPVALVESFRLPDASRI